VTRTAVAALLVAAMIAAACAPGREQLLLEQFFQASRLRDRTALQRIATVIFEPLEQGTVTDFTITAAVDVPDSPAGVKARQVTVTAPVRLPNGQTATRKILLLLERRTDRWLVTGFTTAAP
jgi:hypothetical protein